jgi:3-dehydroquinate synthase
VAKNVKLFCIADSCVLKRHSDKAKAMRKLADIIEVDGGEASKCFGKVAEICSLLAQKKADRKSCIIAWGGGVIGDLAGFIASVYMRGIKFYQIPTTLLAMVDSSVGGKTGINIEEGKNLVGAFHQPQGVFADIDFLDTLPEREFSAGMAEVIKCGLLGDVKLFEDLENIGSDWSRNHSYLSEAILRSCALKAKIVAEDEHETASSGGRALLNFGHTFGHAIEKLYGYGTYRHGEAVAIGMLMANELSKVLGGADFKERISHVVACSKLPMSVANQEISVADFVNAMAGDKKNSNGQLRFVVLENIGDAKTVVVDKAIVEKVVEDCLK